MSDQLKEGRIKMATSGLKSWQARIWTGDGFDVPNIVYGDSLASLRGNAKKWLNKETPKEISNLSPTAGLRSRVSIVYSDGSLLPAFPRKSYYGKKTLEEGWHYVEAEFSDVQGLDGFQEVVEKIIRNIVPEKGPDYKEIALVEGKIQLYLLRTIKREESIEQVNDCLQRGWYIIAIEFDGHVDIRERLVSSKTIFVLGHPEDSAV